MKQKGNNIGWCDKTANPVCGCDNGCTYCYARSMNNRFHWVPDFSKPQFFPNRLKEFRTKEPMIIFIDSMSDIGWWEWEWFMHTAKQMFNYPRNVYLALTKQYAAIQKIQDWFSDIDDMMGWEKEYMPRFFIGATITNNAQAQAVIEAGGADFISFEPLLEQIKPELLDQLRCMWWIVGDLTKNGKPQGVTQYEWVCNMEYLSDKYDIPMFTKDSLCNGLNKSFLRAFPKGWKE